VTGKKRQIIVSLLNHVLLSAMSAAMLVPIVWSLITSFQKESAIHRYPPGIELQSLVFENYVRAFTAHPVGRFILNTIFLSTVSVAIALAISVFSAYVLSRHQFKIKPHLLIFILFPMMVPGLTNLIPLYAVFGRLGLIDTYAGLIIMYLPGVLPFSIWVLKNFFDSVPVEIEESAQIDGCAGLRMIASIVAPIAMPGLVAVSVINFVRVWNEFVMTLIFTTSTKMKTIAVGIYYFLSFDNVEIGALNAAAMATLIPIVLFFIAMKNKFIAGMAEGAVKG